MLFEILTIIPRIRAKLAVSKKLDVLEGTIDTIRNERARAVEHGALTLLPVHDAALYCLCLQLDHTVFLYHLTLERNSLRRSVYSKNLALVYYEFFDDFPQILGKEFKRALEALPSSEKLVADLREIQRGLKEFRKVHEQEFKEIRNLVAAHRDVDATKQLSVIDSIDHDLIQSLSTDIEDWFLAVWRLFAASMNAYSLSPQMIKDICKKIEQDGSANSLHASRSTFG